jgi:hypothetical protein
VDEQLEIARKWYPSGQLEAERIRVRNRTGGLLDAGQDDGSHWISDAIIYTTLGTVIWCFAELGQWAAGEWWGGLVGVAVFAVACSAGKQR